MSPGEKTQAAAQQVSLIGFDFDDPPPPTSATSPLDQFGGLSLGPSSPSPAESKPTPNSQILSLFDLNPEGFSPMAPSQTTSKSQVSGSYFANPASSANGQLQARPNYAAGGQGGSGSGSSGMPIQWGSNGSPAGSPALGRSSTPGAIQLSDSYSVPPPPSSSAATMRQNESSTPTTTTKAAGQAKDPFGDLEGLF